jgi:hypothetical protein
MMTVISTKEKKNNKEEIVRRFLTVSISFILCILFISCLGIENTYTINDNGSGRMVFQYRISQMFKSLGKQEAQEEKKDVPFPITKAELEKSISKVEGLKVVSVTQWEDESDVYIKGEIEFVNIETLNKSEMLSGMPISFSRDGEMTTFAQVIMEKRDPVDEESLKSYESMFEGYMIILQVNAPRTIISANLGEISPDGRSVTYKISMADFMKMTARTELRVIW